MMQAHFLKSCLLQSYRRKRGIGKLEGIWLNVQGSGFKVGGFIALECVPLRSLRSSLRPLRETFLSLLLPCLLPTLKNE